MPVCLCAEAFLGSPGPACHLIDLRGHSPPPQTPMCWGGGLQLSPGAVSSVLAAGSRGLLYIAPGGGGGGDGSIGGRSWPGPAVVAGSARAEQLSGGRVTRSQSNYLQVNSHSSHIATQFTVQIVGIYETLIQIEKW